MDKQISQTAIIGAGLAGLACAEVLREHGIDACVFDRGREPGGRLSSRLVPIKRQSTVCYDYGAPAIDIRSDAFGARAQKWVDAGVGAWWSPRVEHADGSITSHQRVLVGVPSMNSIIQSLAEGVDVRHSTQVTKLVRADQCWALHLDSYEHDEPRVEFFERVVLAMPAVQAARLVDLQTEQFGVYKRLRSCTNWVCMMALHVGEQISALPDIIDTQQDDRMVLTHRRPGQTLPSGITGVMHYANAEFSSAHREVSKADMLPLLRERMLSMLERHLGTRIAAGQVLDERVHRWGLARPIECLNLPHLYDRSLSIGCCGDGFLGADAQAAYESGRTLGLALLE